MLDFEDHTARFKTLKQDGVHSKQTKIIQYLGLIVLFLLLFPLLLTATATSTLTQRQNSISSMGWDGMETSLHPESQTKP